MYWSKSSLPIDERNERNLFKMLLWKIVEIRELPESFRLSGSFFVAKTSEKVRGSFLGIFFNHLYTIDKKWGD